MHSLVKCGGVVQIMALYNIQQNYNWILTEHLTQWRNRECEEELIKIATLKAKR